MNNTPDFTRRTLIATVKGHNVFITAKWKEGNLSITGVEGPMNNGNCWGSCGQIDSGSWDDYKAVGSIDLTTIKHLWNRWHLNDMRAGDAVQEEWLRENGHGKDYTATCEKLKGAGLLVHEGYQYGHAWKREEVPAEVVAYFNALPDDTEKMPKNCWR